MRLFVDAARLRTGGGLQVGVELFRQLESDPEFDCTWRIPKPFRKELLANGLDVPEDAIARALKPAAEMAQFATVVRKLDPDAVFTVFGPAFVPAGRRPHIAGYAVPWSLYPKGVHWDVLDAAGRRRRRLREALRRPTFKVPTHFWIETEAGKAALQRLSGLPAENIAVTGNTCANAFRTWDGKAGIDRVPPKREPDEFRLLTLSSYYPHKNLDLIPKVAAALAARSPRPFRFFLSLPEDSDAWRTLAAEAAELGVADRVQTVGKVPLAECPGLYAATDALFLPTLLEVFSATYPEAMQMKRPIITSDVIYASEVCQGAARYFRPTDAESAAEAVLHVAGSSELVQTLVEAGTKRLRDFPDTEERARRIKQLIRTAVQESTAL